jgi:hypothetical protein
MAGHPRFEQTANVQNSLKIAHFWQFRFEKSDVRNSRRVKRTDQKSAIAMKLPRWFGERSNRR